MAFVRSGSYSIKDKLIQVESSLEEVKSDIGELKSSVEKIKTSLIEVEKVLKQYLPSILNSEHPPNSSSFPHQAESIESKTKSLQLCFKGQLPDTLLTKNKIDEDASLILELCDASGEKVEGCLYPDLKVKIVVLDGDFHVEDTDDWTEEDFKRYIASPRKDREPLLKGNYEFSLSRGCAKVCDISFTDNSKAMRNGKFRLGAQVIKGLPSGELMRPAVSTSFQVKENRLKTDRKHPTPSLGDDLWRLININKTGPIFRRALDNNIRTVQDFLQLYHTDEKKMQKILRVAQIKWEAIVKNAEACKLTGEDNYKYYDKDSGDILILNCVFNIVSVTFKGQTSQAYESLNASQKEKVGKLREAAYEVRDKLEKVGNEVSVPAGPSYSTIIQKELKVQHRQQSAVPSSSMYPNVVGVLQEGPVVASFSSDQNSLLQHLDTSEVDQESVRDIIEPTRPTCSITDAYGRGGNYTSLALENLTPNVADYGPNPQILLPTETIGSALCLSANVQFFGSTSAVQGGIDMQASSYLSSSSPSYLDDFIIEDLDLLSTQPQFDWNKYKNLFTFWVSCRVVTTILRWRAQLRRLVAVRRLPCRPPKRQRI